MREAAKCLADLNDGEQVVISEVEDHGAISRRLMDLGFLPGTRIQTLQHAPFGDPITFLIRGYRIGLRRAEASIIRILPTAGD